MIEGQDDRRNRRIETTAWSGQKTGCYTSRGDDEVRKEGSYIIKNIYRGK